MVLKIESSDNSKIKNLIKLRDSSRERKKQGLFIIEGYREISLAQKAGVEITTLVYCQDYIKNELAIDEEKIVEVSKKIFDKASGRENPDGFLAIARAEEIGLAAIKLSAKPLVIILEAVEKPGNLGAILRTADAVGADAVIINDQQTDIYNPNVIRASQGAVFTVKVISSTQKDTLEFCRKNKIKIFITTPGAKAEYTDADFKSGAAIVLGAEDRGLSPEWLKAGDEAIKIKMRGQADSLNVSVSAAVILFEAVRQREG